MSQIENIFEILNRVNIFSRAPWDSHSIIWHSMGLKIRNNYINLIKEQFLNSNYDEFLFPAIIPEDLLKKQYEHYRDIRKISFQLDGKSNKILRSTSESQFASFVSSIKYFNQPIKLFQECSVFRRETDRNIIPLLRDIEINPFIEFMTFSNESQKEVENEIDIFSRILNKLCLPEFYSLRPKWDTFPEAIKTFAFDLPVADLGFYQLASIHDLSNSFSREFGITDNNGCYLNQTSSGISGRALFTTIIEHFTPPFIILPSALVPYSVGIDEKLINKYGRLFHGYNTGDFLIGKNFGELRKYNPLLPFIIVDIDLKYIRLEDHLGHQYKIKKVFFRDEITKLLNCYDDNLRLISRTRFNDKLKTRDILLQFPSCGKLLCIKKKIIPSIKFKLLGFSRLSKASSFCDICSDIETYQTRLENVC